MCQNLERVDFEAGSKIECFPLGFIAFTSIKHLKIPGNVRKFCTKWCNDTPKLTDIQISPENSFCTYYKNSFIICKSDPHSYDYDVLLISPRNTSIRMIPYFIKKIASCAFDSCKNINVIEFEIDSELRQISSEAFTNSSIKSIIFPPKLRKIKLEAFYNCSQLEYISFMPNSSLVLIDQLAFSKTALKAFYAPDSLIEISGKAFSGCVKLKNIYFSPNSNLRIIGQEAFRKTGLISVLIPKTVIQIGFDAFACCKDLLTVDFSLNSNFEIEYLDIINDSPNAHIFKN